MGLTDARKGNVRVLENWRDLYLRPVDAPCLFWEIYLRFFQRVGPGVGGSKRSIQAA